MTAFWYNFWSLFNSPGVFASFKICNFSFEEAFNNSKEEYQKALNNSGYDFTLKFESQDEERNKKRKRRRNVLWFNPPFSNNVKTNVGKRFLHLIKKHFPKKHRLHKIFNKNTVKLSYSCLPNIKTTIKTNNSALIQKSKDKTEEVKTEKCNCRVKSSCPLNGGCQISSVIYKATVNTASQSFKYIGLTEGPFKKRYSGHKNSFDHRKNRLSTELSKKIWDLKDSNTVFEIKWEIIQRANGYRSGSLKCNLCISEKLHILKEAKTPGLLNKRSEIVSKCRHENKFLLRKIADVT